MDKNQQQQIVKYHQVNDDMLLVGELFKSMSSLNESHNMISVLNSLNVHMLLSKLSDYDGYILGSE